MPTLEIERKAVPIALHSFDDDTGTFEALVSVTNVPDTGGDIIMPGAYKQTLLKRLPKVCWSHSWEHPIGKVLAAEELMPGDRRLPAKLLAQGAGALWVKGRFNLATQRGRDAYNDVKFWSEPDGSGTTSEWSIGYDCQGKEGKSRRNDDGYREIYQLALYEVSPVLFGMAENTGTLTVKSLVESGGLDPARKYSLKELRSILELKVGAAQEQADEGDGATVAEGTPEGSKPTYQIEDDDEESADNAQRDVKAINLDDIGSEEESEGEDISGDDTSDDSSDDSDGSDDSDDSDDSSDSSDDSSDDSDDDMGADDSDDDTGLTGGSMDTSSRLRAVGIQVKDWTEFDANRQPTGRQPAARGTAVSAGNRHGYMAPGPSRRGPIDPTPHDHPQPPQEPTHTAAGHTPAGAHTPPPGTGRVPANTQAQNLQPGQPVAHGANASQPTHQVVGVQPNPQQNTVTAHMQPVGGGPVEQHTVAATAPMTTFTHSPGGGTDAGAESSSSSGSKTPEGHSLIEAAQSALESAHDIIKEGIEHGKEDSERFARVSPPQPSDIASAWGRVVGEVRFGYHETKTAQDDENDGDENGEDEENDSDLTGSEDVPEDANLNRGIPDEDGRHDMSAMKQQQVKRDFAPNVGGGVDRDKLKASDFVFGDTRTFPVVTAGDVSDAVSSWGHYKGPRSFEDFKRNLTALAHRKGFEGSLPAAWKDGKKAMTSVKAWINMNGSYEDTICDLNDAVDRWMDEVFPGEVVNSWVEATYGDHAIVGLASAGAASDWDDPTSSMEFWKVPYEIDRDDMVTFGMPTTVPIQGVAVDRPDETSSAIDFLPAGNVLAKGLAMKNATRLRRRYALLAHLGQDISGTGLTPEMLRWAPEGLSNIPAEGDSDYRTGQMDMTQPGVAGGAWDAAGDSDPSVKPSYVEGEGDTPSPAVPTWYQGTYYVDNAGNLTPSPVAGGFTAPGHESNMSTGPIPASMYGAHHYGDQPAPVLNLVGTTADAGTLTLLGRKPGQTKDAADDKKCPTCKGSGMIKGGKVKCPDCHGTGVVDGTKNATRIRKHARLIDTLNGSQYRYGGSGPLSDDTMTEADAKIAVLMPQITEKAARLWTAIKEGRVLSADNLDKVRAAHSSLTDLLTQAGVVPDWQEPENAMGGYDEEGVPIQVVDSKGQVSDMTVKGLDADSILAWQHMHESLAVD